MDNRTADNPYHSKFGVEWRQHIMKSQTFSHCEGIWNYIEHMMTESANAMKGTIHEDSWMVYHDALSLMTASKTKEWMREKGYLRRWILPTSNLYDGLPEVKAKYKDNPLGNSPEYMP